MKLTLKSDNEFIRNNNSMLKIQQRFKIERHYVFTEEIRFLQVQMMIRECNQLIQKKRMRMEQEKI